MLLISQEKLIFNKAKKLLKKINILEKEIKNKSTEELYQQYQDIKNKIQKENIPYDTNTKFYNTNVVIVIAITRELSFRIRRERPFDSQIIGALCLNERSIIEMQTGQGKTLSAVLSASFKSLFGKVHIVTANDYLAKRDYESQEEIYSTLGIELSFITEAEKNTEKIYRYNNFRVLYISITALCFDFLKSNMQYNENKIMLHQKDMQHVIVDEIDFILLDSGSTPIVISSTTADQCEEYIKYAYQVISHITINDTVIDHDKNDIYIKESSRELLESLISKYYSIPKDKIYSEENIDIMFYIDRQLRAKFLLRKNYEYIVHNKKIQIIDQYTGRISPDKQYTMGLHQAVEAKEKTNITAESSSVAFITTQNLFRLYKYITGMTGTAYTDRKEFQIIYNVCVVRVPKEEKNYVCYHRERFFANKELKYKFISSEVKKAEKTKQPILIGTSNINESEEIARIFNQNNIEYNILNAKYIEKEAEIIANAGEPGKVTISTNMAGRGTDIKLGGSFESKYKSIIMKTQNATQEQKDEIYNEIHKEYEKQRKIAYDAGGLKIIITQRQENRRTDRQFKGRTGRRDDNGEIICLCSPEDEIFKYSKTYAKMVFIITNGFNDGTNSLLLENIASRLQTQQENMSFESRINTLTKDHAIHRCRTAFFNIRYKILRNNIDYIKTCKNIIEKLYSYNENNNKYFENIIKKYYIDTGMNTNINKLSIVQYINNMINIHANINFILLHLEEIKNTILSIIDKLWAEFLNNSNIISKARFFKQKVDPILEFNKSLLELFEQIFDGYEHNILKIIINIINKHKSKILIQ